MELLLNSCRRKVAAMHFKVVSVKRVENAMLWSSYVNRRTQLYRARNGDRCAQQAQVRTGHANWLQTCTDADIMKHTNEVFLFHGTGKAKAIASNGFLHNKRRSAPAASSPPLFGDRFGNGFYFAEDSDKVRRGCPPPARPRRALPPHPHPASAQHPTSHTTQGRSCSGLGANSAVYLLVFLVAQLYGCG
jgi:hypothetical protein